MNKTAILWRKSPWILLRRNTIRSDYMNKTMPTYHEQGSPETKSPGSTSAIGALHMHCDPGQHLLKSSVHTISTVDKVQ
jgi:hypothetical protein